MEFLETYAWPGNVRQLRNAMENMVVLPRGDTPDARQPAATLEADPLLEQRPLAPPATSLVALQRAAVEKALADCHGHRTRAAEALGISVRTLQRKLKAWGLENSDPQHAAEPLLHRHARTAECAVRIAGSASPVRCFCSLARPAIPSSTRESCPLCKNHPLAATRT